MANLNETEETAFEQDDVDSVVSKCSRTSHANTNPHQQQHHQMFANNNSVPIKRESTSSGANNNSLFGRGKHSKLHQILMIYIY